MGSKSGERTDISHNDVAECSETTVEIKIKMLDSQTFTLRVDKCVPVPELKEQIASLTGVLSEQQRLICRGKVLKDDQLLSAYRILCSFDFLFECGSLFEVLFNIPDVEDGHTLHLVVRQPVVPSPESSFDHPATDPVIETGLNPGNSAGSGMVVGTFNLSEQGDGAFPDLNRIVSAVLSTFGVPRSGNGGEGIDLNVLPSERHPTVPSHAGFRNSSRMQLDQLGAASVPVEAMQPPIIPDALTTLSQYLSHLRQEFTANAGGQIGNFGNTGFSERVGHELNTTIHSNEARGLLTPESLAEVMTSTRQLLVGQATECLSQLAVQLQCHSNVTDPLERSRIQSSAIRSGALFQNLGSLLLELGRAIMTLRMGQTPADAIVNTGPSVFVSSTGPNPIMVQPLPFQPGASFGSIPVGTAQQGSGLASGSGGSGYLPRNIDIRIRTGSVFSRRDTIGSQPQGQGVPVSSDIANSDPQEPAGPDSNSSNREPQVRTIPVRTVVAAVPAAVGRGSDPSRSSIGILYPVLARVQQVTAGNPNGAIASEAVDQHHGPVGNTQQPMSVSGPQQQNDGMTGGSDISNSAAEVITGEEFSAQIQGGLEQLLRTLLPGENANPLSSGLFPSPSEVRQDIGSAADATAPTVSEEGITLSNMLRQLMPMITENVGTSSVQTQADANGDVESSSTHERAWPPESPQRPKRQKVFPSERHPTVPSHAGFRNSSRMQLDQLGASVPVEAMQPPVALGFNQFLLHIIIPDALTTLSQYLSHLRQEFTANGLELSLIETYISSILFHQLFLASRSVFSRRDTIGSQPQGQGVPVSSDIVNSDPQEPAGPDSNSSNREPQVRTIPVRTVVAAVPAAVGRGSDPSRSSIGILYPVLARVQQVTAGNPNGAIASEAVDQHHGPVGNTQQPMSVSGPQQQNDGMTGGSENITDPSATVMASTICALILDSTSEEALLQQPNFNIDDLTSLSLLLKRSLATSVPDLMVGNNNSEADLHQIIALCYSSWEDRFPRIKGVVER
ncbi:large proline-rich protein bag6-B-like [Dorcoceras hygrometricum]|uniref:Large proline-rich protein bag6-B-like n=1 Tax=Dorcoceras hygrometricum TaxID=472368 RepID=A0A2Z7DDA6_9LAMI|nr:large proline-rich protein bag6-B-like [Dorcoceras hygrometricum]